MGNTAEYKPSNRYAFSFPDNRPFKCIYTSKNIRRIPRCVSMLRIYTAIKIPDPSWYPLMFSPIHTHPSPSSLLSLTPQSHPLFLSLPFPPLPRRQLPSNGADGRQPLPSHSDGAGSRAALLSAVSDAVRNKTPPLGGDHPQGLCSLA